MSSGASRTVSGSPISVLRFSRLAWTRPGSSARAMSLTEVLPTEPVTPTTRAPSARRQVRASACIAASGSSTANTQAPARPLSSFVSDSGTKDDSASRRTTTPQAPASIAAGANSPPSRWAPRRPKKRSPAPACAGVDRRRGRRLRVALGEHLGPQRRRDLPGSRGSRRAAQLPQLLAGDLAVVEGDLAPALELLPLLVALAGDDDGVARLGLARAPARSRRGGRPRPRPRRRRPSRRRPRRRSPPGPRSAGCRR